MSSAKWRAFCLGLNVLKCWPNENNDATVNRTVIGSSNDLSPVRCQSITGTKTCEMSIGPPESYFSKIEINVRKTII